MAINLDKAGQIYADSMKKPIPTTTEPLVGSSSLGNYVLGVICMQQGVSRCMSSHSHELQHTNPWRNVLNTIVSSPTENV